MHGQCIVGRKKDKNKGHKSPTDKARELGDIGVLSGHPSLDPQLSSGQRGRLENQKKARSGERSLSKLGRNEKCGVRLEEERIAVGDTRR